MILYQMFLATIPHHTNTSCSDDNAQAIPSLFVAAARDGAPASASRLHKGAAAVAFIHWRPPLVKHTKRQLDSISRAAPVGR